MRTYSGRFERNFEEKTRDFTYDPIIPEGQKPNPLGMR